MDGLALYFRKAFFWLQNKGGEMRGRDNNQDTIPIVQMSTEEGSLDVSQWARGSQGLPEYCM